MHHLLVQYFVLGTQHGSDKSGFCLQFGSVGLPDADKLRIYMPADEARARAATKNTEPALAQRVAESVIAETMVWTVTREGQVSLSHLGENHLLKVYHMHLDSSVLSADSDAT